jgi:hypothetical protein
MAFKQKDYHVNKDLQVVIWHLPYETEEIMKSLSQCEWSGQELNQMPLKREFRESQQLQTCTVISIVFRVCLTLKWFSKYGRMCVLLMKEENEVDLVWCSD